MNIIYKFFIIVPIVSALSLLTSCDSKAPQGTPSHPVEKVRDTVEFTPEQMQSADIQFSQIEQRIIGGSLKVNGILDVPPQQKISVSVPLGGFLKSTTMLQGSRVKKGQLLAVIEHPDFIQLQQDYLEAKNQLEYAQADYERQQELAKENFTAQKTFQLARTTYQNWLAKRNGLLAKLKLINVNITNLEAGNISSTANVYSSINGFVTQVNVNIGMYVRPTDVIFQIVDTEHLHAELTVFEKDVPFIKIGQKVRFTLANETLERIATVHLIGREIGAERTIRIHSHLDREDRDLLPGMYLKAIIETGGDSVNALPNDAIVDYQGKKYIFVPIENIHEKKSANKTDASGGQQFKMIEIRTGKSELGFTEVVLPEDWTMDTRVVSIGAYSILSKIMNIEAEK
ncbi:MAG: efflux RND transporter periplasmic adaptor subunit [Ignavibacteria bacterium]|nr:efflux RND transporter periplasmic adaptor subunit [Ignavibacteria bacterium]